MGGACGKLCIRTLKWAAKMLGSALRDVACACLLCQGMDEMLVDAHSSHQV